MTDIPDDLMDIAFGLTAGDWNQPHDVRAKKVAVALFRERERCIALALSEKPEYPQDEADRAYDAAIDHVVEVIRTPTTRRAAQ